MIGDITLSVEHNYTTRAGMLSREHIPHLSFNPSEGQNQQLQWSLHNVKNMLSSYKVLPLNNSIDESNIQPELLQEKLIYAGQPGGGRAKRETSGLLPSREKTSDGRLQTTPAVTVARILTMGVDTNAPIV